MAAALFAPLLPVALWLLLRLAARDRLRPGAFVGAAVSAGAVGLGVAAWSLATEVTDREETQLSAAVLYDAIAAAGGAMGSGAVGFVLVFLAEIALRGRPVGGPRAFGVWVTGGLGLLALVRAGVGTWGLLGKVGEVAIVLDQRKSGVPARAVDGRAIVSALFSTGAITAVAFVLGVVALALAVAPRKPAAAPPR